MLPGGGVAKGADDLQSVEPLSILEVLGEQGVCT